MFSTKALQFQHRLTTTANDLLIKQRFQFASNTNKLTGLKQLRKLSFPMSCFMGTKQASIIQVKQKIWSYIRLNNLQDSNDGRIIYCDDYLKSIFKSDIILCFISSPVNMNRLLVQHYQ